MTGPEFSEVDHDLLADYVGGALDGTPDEAVVTALIAGDPAWRTAHDSLTVAVAAVGADLRALGATPERMPDDIAARITAALATATATGTGTASTNADGHRGAGEAAAGSGDRKRHLSLVPGGATAAARPATVRRRPLLRRAAPIATAAAVLAFAGVGVERLWGAGNDGQADRAATSAADPAAQAPARENAPMLASEAPESTTAAAGAGLLAAAPPPEGIVTSDRDYRGETLAGLAAPLDSAAPDRNKQAPASPGEIRAQERVSAPGLQRLGDPAALQECLQAIARELDRGPITVGTAEYARFEGAPALIVRFTADREWAWAAGPECGAPGRGADTLARVPVG